VSGYRAFNRIEIRRRSTPQCEIIQGRLVGKLFVPPLPRFTIRDVDGEQHEQPARWLPFIDDSVRGAFALRSLVAWASRNSAEVFTQRGAVRITRGALRPHSGQSDGCSYSDIARIMVKAPQRLHMYS
jgi:hypothetical protein